MPTDQVSATEDARAAARERVDNIMTPDRAYSLASAGAAPRANEDGRDDELVDRGRNGYFAPSQPTSRPASSPSNDTLIFIHLYKTGGTTLNRIIEWEYKMSKICSVEPTWWQWSYQRITRWSPRRLNKMEVFKGHMPFGLHRLLPRPANYVTVLREPVERAISDYYFARRFKPHRHHRAALQLSLEEFFLQKHEHNLQSRILAGPNSHELFPSVCDAGTLAAAKDNLARRFIVVGLTERFDETLALLKVLLGWQIRRYRSFRVADNRVARHEVAAKTLALIRERERFDIALYDYASSLFDKAIAAHRETVEAMLPSVRRARQMTSLDSRYYFASSIARAIICRAHSLL